MAGAGRKVETALVWVRPLADVQTYGLFCSACNGVGPTKRDGLKGLWLKRLETNRDQVT